jgi:ubiquinone/menaquinone biosynthesis C-methylase UbiE
LWNDTGLVYDLALYSQIARYYDRIYWFKDYAREVDFLVGLFKRYRLEGRSLLEVGCGTGSHTKALVASGYRVTAVDLSEDMLRIARRKVARGATFTLGDMRYLDEAVQDNFDAVVCLFSTVSYNRTRSELRDTLAGFYRHVRIGGLVAFDTHFTKKSFEDGYRGEDIFDDGRVIGARLSTAKRNGDIGEISFTYLIKDGRKVLTLRNDRHLLGLFSVEEILGAMKEVGLKDVRTYSDWTFGTRTNEASFKDIIFVGRKR